MEFYTTVVIISAIFLIVCLIVIGILMQNVNKKDVFPPVQQPCPDNWETKGNACVVPSKGNVGKIPTDTINLESPFYKATPGLKSKDSENILTGIPVPHGNVMIDFTDSGWNKNGSRICTQKKWAETYGHITWDGVSNVTGC